MSVESVNKATSERIGSEKVRRIDALPLATIVIPCWNEEQVLPKLFERLGPVASKWGCDFEVILVDDGSTDSTWELIQSFHQVDPRWKGIRLGRNFGHQLALRAGLHLASGEVVVVLDADLQDPPEVAGEMLGRWEQGYDVVVGVRQRRKEGFIKRSLYYLFYRILATVAELKLPLDAGDFCVMDRSVVEAIKLMPESRPFIRGLRSWVGHAQVTYPYDRAARQAGTTKYTYWKLFALAADGILSNSRVPLHVATVLGALSSVTAFVAAVGVLIIRIFPAFGQMVGYVQGTASIIIAVLFMGGVQLLCLGVIGAYIGRIHENVMFRPLWTVRAAVGIDLSNSAPFPSPHPAKNNHR